MYFSYNNLETSSFQNFLHDLLKQSHKEAEVSDEQLIVYADTMVRTKHYSIIKKQKLNMLKHRNLGECYTHYISELNELLYDKLIICRSPCIWESMGESVLKDSNLSMRAILNNLLNSSAKPSFKLQIMYWLLVWSLMFFLCICSIKVWDWNFIRTL